MDSNFLIPFLFTITNENLAIKFYLSKIKLQDVCSVTNYWYFLFEYAPVIYSSRQIQKASV